MSARWRRRWKRTSTGTGAPGWEAPDAGPGLYRPRRRVHADDLVICSRDDAPHRGRIASHLAVSHGVAAPALWPASRAVDPSARHHRLRWAGPQAHESIPGRGQATELRPPGGE